MKTKTAFMMLAIAVPLILTSSLFADDKADVNSLLDSIEACYTSRDAAALSNTLSDYFVGVVDNPADPANALILNKIQILELMKKMFAAETNLVSHKFTNRDIMASGNIAFIRTTVEHQTAGAAPRISNEFRIAIKEQNTWRIVAAFPIIFQPAVMITSLVPDGQAQKMGLLPGDLITSYAGEKIESAAQLMALTKLHSKDPAGTKIPFNAKRGDKEVTLQSEPALLGIHMETRLLPSESARLVNLQDDHPVKDVAKRLSDATRQRNIPAYLAETSINGLLYLTTSESAGEITIISRTNAAEMLASIWQKAAEVFDYPSLEYLGCRAIAKENLALVVLEWKIKFLQGQTSQIPDIYIFAREQGNWRVIYHLFMQGVNIGLDVPPPTNPTPAPAAAVPAGATLLCNFDAGDPLSSPFFPTARWTPERKLGDAISICELDSTNPYGGSPFCLRWEYCNIRSWGILKFRFNFGTGRTADLSRFKTLSFYIRGAKNRDCRFAIWTDGADGNAICCEPFPISVTQNWQRVDINLGDERMKNVNISKTRVLEFNEPNTTEAASNIIWLDEFLLQ